MIDGRTAMVRRLSSTGKTTFLVGVLLGVPSVIASLTFAQNVVGNPWSTPVTTVFAVAFLSLVLSFCCWMLRGAIQSA